MYKCSECGKEFEHCKMVDVVGHPEPTFVPSCPFCGSWEMEEILVVSKQLEVET